jgi:hypothetical protein
MEELYAEGLATHGDPESCVDDPQGRGEALTGASAGRAIGGVQESSPVVELGTRPLWPTVRCVCPLVRRRTLRPSGRARSQWPEPSAQLPAAWDPGGY